MDGLDSSRPRPTRFRRLLRSVTGARPEPGTPAAASPAPPAVPAERPPTGPAAPVPEPPAPRPEPGPTAAPAETTAAEDRAAARSWRAFQALIRETYPSVAEPIEALASQPPLDMVDEWIGIARLLSDDRHHRTGGLAAEARERALHAAVSEALEAQARSSARIAGFPEPALDDEWSPDPAWVGQTVWEHYLCREAVLVRESLHGEELGTWLAALGELWAAANDLLLHTDDLRTVRVLDVQVARPTPLALPAPTSTSAPASPPERTDAATEAVAPEVVTPELVGGPGVTTSEVREPVSPVPTVEGPLSSTTSISSPEEALDAARVRLRSALKVAEELAHW